jgi:hypothetical protein
MDPIALYRFLEPKPFQPVRVYLKDGTTYDVRFRELIGVGTAWVNIGIPAPGEADAIYDHVVKVPLEEIDRVERISAAPEAAPR